MMAASTFTGQDLLSRLSSNISVKSVKPDNSQLQNLPAGISISSVPQEQAIKSVPKVDNISKPGNEMWDQFEQFRQWQQSSSIPSPAANNSSLNTTANSTIVRTLITPQSTVSRTPVSNITRTSNKVIFGSRSSTSTTPASGASNYKRMSHPSNNKFNRRSLPTNRSNILPNVAFQTLNQPLNPNVFLPGALKCFPKSRSQIANTKNPRKYPQLSNESFNRQASIFMAAPTPEILAQMRQEGFAKDFQLENCRSSSEYLHCLLGYGLHQTLNFPIMGVFYLELVRLIMKHMDRFSSNENVKLIQVSNVCEDILRQNSTRDDFLPVEVMDKIVEEAVNEETSIQKMIEDFNGGQEFGEEKSKQRKSEAVIPFKASQVSNDVNQKLNMFANISVSLASEPKTKDVSKNTDVIIDLEEVEDPPMNLYSNHLLNVKMPMKKLAKRNTPKRICSPHFTRSHGLSDDLASFLGMEKGSKLSRQEVVKKLWVYVKEKKLQDPQNGQFLTPDEAMEPIFGKEKIRGFGMVKYLKGHLLD